MTFTDPTDSSPSLGGNPTPSGAHDGSIGILHSYIDALASTGVDIIKFQTHIAEAESSEHEPDKRIGVTG